MAVYAENIGGKRAQQVQGSHDSQRWGGTAAEVLVGFALRVIALLVIVCALSAIVAAAGLARPVWLRPADEQRIEQRMIIPPPWSGQHGA